MCIYNVYCDESCHLEHDNINVMVLGAIWCNQKILREVNNQIKQIKKQNKISLSAELKWTKVSPSNIQVFKDVINYYFDNNNLHFRALVIKDKSKLDHERFNQTHDDWYYKMYFDMLKTILSPSDRYEIYIDIKDTNSYKKANKLRNICCNSMYDFSQEVIKRLQPVRSDEIQIMQIVDILIGAIGYSNRIFDEKHIRSQAKLELVDLIKERSGYSLEKTTLLREDKCNLFIWDPR